MLPGLPFVALGRNPWMAWGGTSLHASSSELVAVPADEVPHLQEREAKLKVRWGRKRRIRIRESRWGPIVSDIGLLDAGSETLALRWMGHLQSDEGTAMLAANRAHNWDEFRAAFRNFAIPGQNMLCATSSARIGRLMAVRVPRRSQRMSEGIVVQPMANDGWDAPVGSAELPQTLDPDVGFITSANERPRHCGALVGDLFSAGDRKQRLEELLSSMNRVSFDAVARIQRDTCGSHRASNAGSFLPGWRIPGLAPGSAASWTPFRHGTAATPVIRVVRSHSNCGASTWRSCSCRHGGGQYTARPGERGGSSGTMWTRPIRRAGTAPCATRCARQPMPSVPGKPGETATGSAWAIRWRWCLCSVTLGISPTCRPAAAQER
jgi:hypothetical protein